VGTLSSVAGVGDLRSILDVGTLSSVAGARLPLPSVASANLLSPSAGTEASTPAHCGAGGGLSAVTASKSSDSEKSTMPVEGSSSSMDSGVVGGESLPLRSGTRLLVVLLSLSLFLAVVAFASSFLF
jgi:hypothetical protein